MNKALTTENISQNKLRTALAFAGEVISETLWPTQCCICDCPGDVLCKNCEDKLQLIDTCFACPICGSPFGTIQCSECNPVVMRSKQRVSIPFKQMASCFILDDSAKKIITTFKDHDEHRLCKIIAAYMARYINPSWVKRSNAFSKQRTEAIITFIPATKAAFRRRGFDHAELIAENIAEITHIKYLNVFERPKTEDQRALSKSSRALNMKGKFKIRDKTPIYSDVILIDDICTTGATLFSASDELKRYGFTNIYALTFGKVLS